jgi:WD40 repeat protein
MPGVFINYRVEDEAYAAALLDRELSDWFGPERVFRASRSIHPGDDYLDELLDNLRRCSVLLAVIGREWLDVVDGAGRLRLYQEQDWVRREIAEAFRCGIRVIPILVADVELPAEDDLPASIARLARCQYLRLHHRNVPHDIARLVDELTDLVPALATARAARRPADPDRAGPGRPGWQTAELEVADRPPAGQPDRAVTLLHLSGTRFRRAVADGNRPPLLDDLTRLRGEQDLVPQLVLVSGDLTEHGMPSEYDRFVEFLEEFRGQLDLPASRFVLVPGDHDVNRRACSAYFDRCAADERWPEPPYVPKWDAFRKMTARLYPDLPGGAFPPDQPWALYELPELGLAVAALNSTMADSHRAEDHYGWLGEQQLSWFAVRMRDLGRLGWLRVGLLHHDPAGCDDKHHLNDADDFSRLLAPHLELVLHGNSPSRAEQIAGPPLLGLGAPAGPAEVGASAYQLIDVRRDRLRVWERRYDPVQRRWGPALDGPDRPAAEPPAGAGGASALTAGPGLLPAYRDGLPVRPADRRLGTKPAPPGCREIRVSLSQAHRVFPALPITGPRRDWADDRRALAPALRDTDDLLDRVAEVCRLKHGPAASVEVVSMGSPGIRYLRVTSPVGAVIRQYPVGVCAGPLTSTEVDRFLARVDAHYRSSDPGVQSVLVYGGEPAADGLRAEAAARGLALVTFPEFQGVYDLRPYAIRQTERLRRDPLYPAEQYVPQRFTMVGRPDSEQDDMLAAVLGWLSDPDGHFVLVLGDFGLGKTFLLRELARRMHAEMRHVVPILVELRALEKAHGLDEMIASHLARAGEQHIDLDKFHYLLRQGRVALLFDGFDELALRVTYDRAAEHLETLLRAVEGRAKVVLTSRTQHFLSDEQVSTALGDRVAMSAGRKLVKLRGFDDGQVIELLTKLLGGDRQRALERFELLSEVRDLLGLSRNPRMLGMVAQLDEQRLRYAQERHGAITAAVLYRELLHQWLEHEYARAQPRGSGPTLSSAERWTAVTELALRLWTSTEPTLGIDDLQDVAAALKNLAARQLDPPRAAHVIGSGTLLVRTDEGRFCFAHPSVMEWLVAADASARLRDGHPPAGLCQREMSPLMAEFFIDLAGRDQATCWAGAVLADGDADDAAKANALLVLGQLGVGQPGGSPVPDVRLAWHDLRGRDLTGRLLADADLHGADLTDSLLLGADLSGADLGEARLTGARMDRASLARADLRGADLRGARLLGADLRDVTVAGSRWRRAALIGARVEEQALAGCDTLAAALPGVPIEPQVQPAPARCHAVGLDPDAGLLATGAADGSVCVWDAATGRPLRILRGHPSRVSAIGFSPDGASLASGSADGRVCIWSITSGTLVRVVTSHLQAVSTLAFSPDGELLATGGADGTLCVWRPDSGEPVLIADDHAGAVTALVFSPSGAALATASADCTVRLWDPDGGALTGVLTGHARAVTAVAFTTGERHVITASADDTVRLWDRGNGQPFHLVHLGGEVALTFSPDGSRLASSDAEDDLHVWEPAFGNTFTVLKGHAGRLTAAGFSPDGERLATAATDETARVWDPVTGQNLCTVRARAAAVTGATFTADGTGLATVGADGVTRLWDSATGECVGTAPAAAPAAGVAGAGTGGADGATTAITATPGGIKVIAAGADAVHVRTPGTAPVTRVPHGHSGVLTALAVNTDGTRLATAGTDHTVRIFDALTGAPLRSLHGHIGAITGAAFGPDGMTLATASTDDTVRIWDSSTGDQIRILYRRAGTMTAVAFSPCGLWLATGSTDGTGQVWNAETGATQGVLYGHAGRITVVTFAPDGGAVATGSTDGSTIVWDPATGRSRHTFAASSGWPEAAVFSPDSRLLAVGGTDGTIRLWSMATGSRLATLVPLIEGWAALLPGLKYKLEGLPAGEFWYVAGMCRFEPGELDGYLATLERLPPRTPLGYGPAPGPDPGGGSPGLGIAGGASGGALTGGTGASEVAQAPGGGIARLAAWV